MDFDPCVLICETGAGHAFLEGMCISCGKVQTSKDQATHLESRPEPKPLKVYMKPAEI